MLLDLANSCRGGLPTLRNNLHILFPIILIDSCGIVLAVEFHVWMGLNEKSQRTSLWVLSINFSVSSIVHPNVRLVCVGTRDSLHFGSTHLKYSVLFFLYCKRWKVKWKMSPATDYGRTLLKKDSFSIFSVSFNRSWCNIAFHGWGHPSNAVT